MSILDTRPPQCQRTNVVGAELVSGFLEATGMRVRLDGPDSRMRYLLARPGEKPHDSFRNIWELALAIELEVVG